MNKKQILQQLHDTANQLEKKGLYAEASVLTNVMTRVAQQPGQSNLNTLYNNFQQNPPQPNQQQTPQQQQQTPQQPGQQAGRQITQQEHNRLMLLYGEWDKYNDRFYALAGDARYKLNSGTMLQEKNNIPNASIMIQQILDYMINLDKEINALLKIENPNEKPTNGKPLWDEMRKTINEINLSHQKMKSTSKQMPQQPNKPVQGPK